MIKLCLVLIFGVSCFCRADNTETYILKSESLPSDLNFMPSLSNGHLGYTVFGDSIFMNGVYNGAAGNSRRARIPNWINITAEPCDLFGNPIQIEANDISYEMDLYNGYFRYRKSYASLGITLEQRTYPHRYYNRALVFELLATRHISAPLNSTPQYLKLFQQPGNASEAFEFVALDSPDENHLLRGRTLERESKRFQPKYHEIWVIFTESLDPPRLLVWPAEQAEMIHRVIICMDNHKTVALKELQDVLRLEEGALLHSHSRAWNNFWLKDFSIEIQGNALELSRIVNAGIFYLASSLPSLNSNQPNEPYFGLSPTGLARGNLDADYEGHNFWDTEIWMLPVATQFSFQYAKILLEYRFRHLDGARYNAQTTGYKGARFPWESAFTGTEVTNPCCPEVAQQEIHISPDITFALQKLFAQSNDYVWLCERACPIATEVAEFLVSRASCDDSVNGPCHFLNIMGPDEDHPNVNDNVYTNAVAKIALKFADWACRRCGNSSTDLQKKWLHLKDRLVILHDQQFDYHPQHLGYQLNTIVKQADTILLGYPLQFDTSSTHLNDLHYYANATRESGPAMTWSMFATNYLATEKDAFRADDYFTRGYQNYVRPEFKVWSETPIGYKGSANFLTGIGGFLQAIIFGYGGINFARFENTSQLQLRAAHMPPQVTHILIKHLKFADSKCIWGFSVENSFLNCTGPAKQLFELIQGDKRTSLTGNFNVTLLRGEPRLSINVLNAESREKR